MAICGAVGALGLGAGLRWAIGGIFAVVREAIAEMHALRVEIREMRVEVRLMMGITPRPDDVDRDRLTPPPVAIGEYSFIRKKKGNQ